MHINDMHIQETVLKNEFKTILLDLEIKNGSPKFRQKTRRLYYKTNRIFERVDFTDSARYVKIKKD